MPKNNKKKKNKKNTKHKVNSVIRQLEFADTMQIYGIVTKVFGK